MTQAIENLDHGVERFRIKVLKNSNEPPTPFLFSSAYWHDVRDGSGELYRHYCRICDLLPELPAGAVPGLVSGDIPFTSEDGGYVRFSYPPSKKADETIEIPLQAMDRTYVIENRDQLVTAYSVLSQARFLFHAGMEAAAFVLLSDLLGEAPAGAVPGLLDGSIRETLVYRKRMPTGDFEFESVASK